MYEAVFYWLGTKENEILSLPSNWNRFLTCLDFPEFRLIYHRQLLYLVLEKGLSSVCSFYKNEITFDCNGSQSIWNVSQAFFFTCGWPSPCPAGSLSRSDGFASLCGDRPKWFRLDRIRRASSIKWAPAIKVHGRRFSQNPSKLQSPAAPNLLCDYFIFSTCNTADFVLKKKVIFIDIACFPMRLLIKGKYNDIPIWGLLKIIDLR